MSTCSGSRRAVRGLVLLGAALVGALAAPAPGEAAFPGRDGAITAVRQSESCVFVPPRGSFCVTTDRLLSVDPATGAQRPLGRPATSYNGSGPIGAVEYSPDGDQIATIDAQGRAGVMDADGTSRRLLQAVDPATGKGASIQASSVGWAPDGRLLIGSTDSLSTYDQADRRLVPIATTVSGFSAPRWSPDGSQILFHDADTNGVSRIAPDGTGRRSFTIPGTNAAGPAFDGAFDLSPDGRRFAFLRSAPGEGEASDVWVADAATGAARRITASHDVTDVAWSPSGTRLALRRPGRIDTVAPDGTGNRRLTRLVEPPNVSIGGLDWRPLP